MFYREGKFVVCIRFVRKDLLAPKTDALVRPSLGDDARSDAIASSPSFIMTDMYI